MRSSLFFRLGLFGVLITILGVVAIIGVALFSTKQPPSPDRISQPTAESVVVNTPAISVLPTSSPLATPTPAVTSPVSPLIINNPTNIVVGEVIQLPDQLYSRGGGFTLRRTDKLPVLSVDQALDYNAGAPWERGGLWNGEQVSVTVTFGSGSLGSLQADGSWHASFNPPEFTCTALRKCTPTGKTLQRVENRPMWVIDYEGLRDCGSVGCDNHTVYIIDDLTGVLFYGFGYSSPD